MNELDISETAQLAWRRLNVHDLSSSFTERASSSQMGSLLNERSHDQKKCRNGRRLIARTPATLADIPLPGKTRNSAAR